MDRKQRVLKSNLTDVSAEVNDILSGSFSLDSAVMYVGAELPFNHKYFNVSTPNAAAKTLSGVALWNGTEWVSCVDVKDGTLSAGKSLAQSGGISWARDLRATGWSCQYDSNDIAALATTRIFNLYWARFTWSNGDGSGVCDYIGELFNTDEELFSLYADLRQTGLMSAYKTGKTSWKDQAFIAADQVVQHLRRNGIITRREQILDSSLYNHAAIHKTAAVIYQGLGQYERAAQAERLFKDAINIKFHEIDRDGSGDVTAREKQINVIYGTR